MFFVKKQPKKNTNTEVEVIVKKSQTDMYRAHPYKGVLLAVEGTDGSGKSTQLALLKKWLESEGYGVVFTEWNSSELVANTIKKGKKKGVLNNTTFSLLHATDFADRLQNIIIPALQAGHIVLSDRFVYTALARDIARNCTAEWVYNSYSFSIKPDATFYFRVPVKISLERITQTRKPKYYEAGMDMELSSDPSKSYLLFQSKVITEYERMINEFGFEVIDGTMPIPEQQVIFRDLAMKTIKGKLK